MGRRAIHTEESILDAARILVLDGGARAATLKAIVNASGAPKGSLYHRFASLNDLLAEVWMRAARRSQTAFINALQQEDPREAAISAALSIYDFAVKEPRDARLLVSLRREDLVGVVASARLRKELAGLNRPLAEALQVAIGHLLPRVTPAGAEQIMFAVIDLPMGAVRRHLIAAKPPPPALRPQLEVAVRAALEHAGVAPQRKQVRHSLVSPSHGSFE